MARAIERAASRSRLARFTLNATRNGRAPMAVAPALGCSAEGPASGALLSEPRPSEASASNWPLLTCSRFLRSGRTRGCLVEVDGDLKLIRVSPAQIRGQGARTLPS